MVGFSEDLRAETKNTAACNVAALRDEMGSDDLASFDAALRDVEEVSANAIHRALKRGGYEVTAGRVSLRRHRRRECACFQVTS